MFRVYKIRIGDTKPSLIFNSDIVDGTIDISTFTVSSNGVGDVTLFIKKGNSAFFNNVFTMKDRIAIVLDGTLEKTNPIFVGVAIRDSIVHGNAGIMRKIEFAPNTVILKKIFTKAGNDAWRTILNEHHGIHISLPYDITNTFDHNFKTSLLNISLTDYIKKVSEKTNTLPKVENFLRVGRTLETWIVFDEVNGDIELKRQQIRRELMIEHIYDLEIVTDSTDYINSFRLNDIEYITPGVLSYDGCLEDVKIDEKFSDVESMYHYAENEVKNRGKKITVSFNQILHTGIGIGNTNSAALEVGNGFTILLDEIRYRCVVTKVTYDLFNTSERGIEGIVTLIE